MSNQISVNRKKKTFHLETLKYLRFLNLFLTLNTDFRPNRINLIKKQMKNGF